MQIQIKKLGKRFDSGWIIRDLDLHIETGQKYAVTGPNGSGKSTLISMIAGYLSQTKGSITYKLEGKSIDRDNIYSYLALSTAYSELDEELNAIELFRHFSVFKPMLISNVTEFLELAELSKHSKKQVKYYSSGMKQRLNLALTMTMDTPLLILDEPTSFLDEDRKNWYQSMVKQFAKGRTVVVASNLESDFSFCDKQIILKTL